MLRNLEPDGLFFRTIGSHSLEKIIRHNYYAHLFATATKKQWPQRVYLGLYSGSGRARVKETGEFVETSAMGALRVRDPFDYYIFVDRSRRCTDALRKRVIAANPEVRFRVICGDVNDVVGDITNILTRLLRNDRVISFCFIDPFAADIRFSTIRKLARFRIDFLILLMLGRDIKPNFMLYYKDPQNTRIAELIDCPDWREEFLRSREGVVPFLQRKFNEAMTRLGYEPVSADLIHTVKIAGKNVPIYSLVLYSQHELAYRLWRDTLRRTDAQLGLGL